MHSPTSQNTSKMSCLSFCRSDNSFGIDNKSSLSNIDLNYLNYTSDYDACNSLRRRVKSKTKHLKFSIHSNSNKKIQRREIDPQDQNIYQIVQQDVLVSKSDDNFPIEEESKDSSPDKQTRVLQIPKKEKSSESINWENKEEEASHGARYIDKCIEDIKKYYELSKLEEKKKISEEYEDYNNFIHKSNSSKSSSFCMENQDKYDNLQEENLDDINRSPTPIGRKENELCKFQKIDWPNSNFALSSNDAEDKSPKSSLKEDCLINELNKKFENDGMYDMNSDLNGLDIMLPTPKDSESDPINSGQNSPFIDNIRPERSFESLHKFNKNSIESVENLEVPSKPVISDFITPRSTTTKSLEDDYCSLKTDEKEKI